jgi:RNA recognition motif. (a.k.a. RRM, RBD, or RNP domain)
MNYLDGAMASQPRQLLADGVPASPEDVDEAVRQYFAQGQHPLPASCEPNAIKLFVGNIPKQLTEAELKPIFACVGPVARISVVRIHNALMFHRRAS